MDLKLMSHNVNGIGDFKIRKRYFNFLIKLKRDIILLQETHSTEKTETQWKNQLRSEIVFSHGSSSSRGVLCTVSPAHEMFSVHNNHKPGATTNKCNSNQSSQFSPEKIIYTQEMR